MGFEEERHTEPGEGTDEGEKPCRCVFGSRHVSKPISPGFAANQCWSPPICKGSNLGKVATRLV